jgi:hypothetical protein
VLLCQHTAGNGQLSNAELERAGQWLRLAPSSNVLVAVTSGCAFKLTVTSLVDVDSLAVGFLSIAERAPEGGGRACKERKGRRAAGQSGGGAAGGGAAGRGRGSAEREASGSGSEGEGEEDAPLLLERSDGPAESAKRGSRGRAGGGGGASDVSARYTGGTGTHAARPSPSDCDEDSGVELLGGQEVLRAAGSRVRVHGLAAKPELNSRVGSVVSYDAAKERYRVRLDAPLSQVLAFRGSNLRDV